MMPTVLKPSDVIQAAADSFRFYDVLPTDDYALADDWPSLDPRAVVERVIGEDVAEGLDALALYLLALRDRRLPDDIDWVAVADACARGYSRHLKPGGARPLRMRFARANFMLRDLLDRDSHADVDILGERRLGAGFVWDWLPVAAGEVVADCGEANVRHLNCANPRPSMRLGLPTQIDPLSGGRVAIGSCYSDGWHVWQPEGQPQTFPRGRPVVLAFEHEGRCLELGVDGVVRNESDAVVARLPIEVVWCARRIDDLVIASDWGEAGTLVVLDLATLGCHRVSSGPVLVTNDICRLNDHYYVLDKMQGRVFATDASFGTWRSRMRFGKGEGRLYDPISVRPHLDALHVLSWITGSLVAIRPF